MSWVESSAFGVGHLDDTDLRQACRHLFLKDRAWISRSRSSGLVGPAGSPPRNGRTLFAHSVHSRWVLLTPIADLRLIEEIPTIGDPIGTAMSPLAYAVNDRLLQASATPPFIRVGAAALRRKAWMAPADGLDT